MPSHDFSLSYLFGGVATYPPGATFGPRVMRDYELLWIISGDTTYCVDDVPHAAPAGSLVFCLPGTTDFIHWSETEPTRHGYFHFSPSHLPDDWPAPAHWPTVITPSATDILVPLFRYTLSQLSPTRGPISQNLRRTVELLIGACVCGPRGLAADDATAFPEPVLRALALVRHRLEETPTPPIHLAELAAAAAASPEHLCRLFRKQFGVSPMEAVRLMRLDLALLLMARSNLSLKEIAHRCGFASPFHFSRRFQRIYHTPPSAMRKRMARGEARPVHPLVSTMLGRPTL